MSMFSNQMVLDRSTIGQKQEPAMLRVFLKSLDAWSTELKKYLLGFPM